MEAIITTKTRSSRIKEKIGNTKNKYFFMVLLFIGAGFIVVSFISEINFHYIQGFMPGNVSDEIFWKAEAVEALNSMIFLSVGIFLVIYATYYYIKKD